MVTISSALEDSQFCLKSIDGEVSLKGTRSYFYQVQTQPYVCKAGFCDFCVCLFHPDSEDDFLVEIVFGTVLCGMFVWKGRDCFCKMFCCLSWLESGTLTSTSYRLSKQVLATESTAVQKSSSASHFRLRLASLDSVSETNLTSRHSAGANWAVQARCCCTSAHGAIPFNAYAQAMNLESAAIAVS